MRQTVSGWQLGRSPSPRQSSAPAVKESRKGRRAVEPCRVRCKGERELTPTAARRSMERRHGGRAPNALGLLLLPSPVNVSWPALASAALDSLPHQSIGNGVFADDKGLPPPAPQHAEDSQTNETLLGEHPPFRYHPARRPRHLHSTVAHPMPTAKMPVHSPAVAASAAAVALAAAASASTRRTSAFNLSHCAS